MQTGAQTVADRNEVVAQPRTDSGQPDIAVVTIEQQSADRAFLLLDRLAHAGHRDMQPGSGATEMKFLRQRQKDLDIANLHVYLVCQHSG
nr:hypothetical protein [Nocardia cyriacigeorgica]